MSLTQYPKLELKYCERCGGLWLRPQGGEAVYCGPCAKAMEEFPPVSPRGGTSPRTQAAYTPVVEFMTAALTVMGGMAA